MPFRLRYMAHDLELPIGEFVVGRSTECQLSLDDPLVARYWWLLPLEDLASFATWVLGFFGNTIVWRGRRLALAPDGSFDTI